MSDNMPFGMIMELAEEDQKRSREALIFRYSPAFHKGLKKAMKKYNFKTYSNVLIDFFDDKKKHLMTVYTRLS